MGELTPQRKANRDALDAALAKHDDDQADAEDIADAAKLGRATAEGDKKAAAEIADKHKRK